MMSDNPRWKDREEAHGLIEQAIYGFHNDYDLDQVLEMLEVALQYDPGNPEGYIYRGIVHCNLKNVSAAELDFLTVLAMDEEAPLDSDYVLRARRQLAHIYINDWKRFQDAEEHFREIIRIEPDSGPAWSSLAMAIFYQGNRGQEVQECFDKALMLGSKDGIVLCNYGSALYMSEEFELAAGVLAEAVKLEQPKKLEKQSMRIQNLEMSQAWEIYCNCKLMLNGGEPMDCTPN